VRARLSAALAAALGLAACKDAATTRKAPAEAPSVAAPANDAGPAAAVTLPPAPALPPHPRGLPPLPSPEHNRTTLAKVELGRMLFTEARLGAGKRALTCAACHQPERGWTDGEARSKTATDQPNLRHTPTLANVGYAAQWYWDGSAPTLEALVLSHWRGQLATDPEAIARALGEDAIYAAHFERAFAGPPTPPRAAEAIAAYVRTLLSGDAPWDRHEAGEAGAVGEDAIAGAKVFTARAGCATCHVPPLYRDAGFHPRRTPDELDPGRMRVTADPTDRGAFATPTLRGVVATAPYFHDGAVATLEQAIDAELARDAVALSPLERGQLIAFVKSLSAPAPPPSELPPPATP
jgi:cytochrome c peroxidase